MRDIQDVYIEFIHMYIYTLKKKKKTWYTLLLDRMFLCYILLFCIIVQYQSCYFDLISYIVC